MNNKDIKSFCPTTKQEWRDWLSENHLSEKAVWLEFYKKSTGKATISWSDAVDEALCFGWIDSVKKTIDDERYKQYFSPRKAKSNWSKVNKEKVDFLEKNNLIAPAGIKSIEIAKENGSWTILDPVENLIVPEDLELALSSKSNSKEFFSGLSKSKRKILLYWVVSAKRTETRTNRINEVVEHASQGQMPKQFR